MDKPRTYEPEYKKEAVKLAKEVGAKKASEELKLKLLVQLLEVISFIVVRVLDSRLAEELQK